MFCIFFFDLIKRKSVGVVKSWIFLQFWNRPFFILGSLEQSNNKSVSEIFIQRQRSLTIFQTFLFETILKISQSPSLSLPSFHKTKKKSISIYFLLFVFHCSKCYRNRCHTYAFVTELHLNKIKVVFVFRNALSLFVMVDVISSMGVCVGSDDDNPYWNVASNPQKHQNKNSFWFGICWCVSILTYSVLE